MWTSGDWEAAAEWMGIALVILNLVGGALIYRMQAGFVTRAEHNNTVKRLDGVEDEVDGIKVSMAQLLTQAGAEELSRRIGVVEQQGAKIIGEMTGIHSQLKPINNMLEMLVQNELKGNKP
jgi:tetrahydromethanopterin S-methyltransferase subunit G